MTRARTGPRSMLGMCDPPGLGRQRWVRGIGGLLSHGWHDRRVPECTGRSSAAVYKLIRTAPSVGYTRGHTLPPASVDGEAGCNRTPARDE
jgi:hypothetical protein